jgi:uncharacterized membrane protein
MMAGWTMGTEAWVAMAAWALVMVVLVWVLVREPHRDAPPDPAAILRERFARGDIDEQELARGLSALADNASGPSPVSPRHPSSGGTTGQEARHD